MNGRQVSRPSALLALALLLPLPSLGAAAALHWWPGAAWSQVVFGLCKVALLILPACWHRWVDGQPWRWPRLPSAQHIWAGLASGLLIAVIVAAGILLAADRLFDVASAAEHLAVAGFDSPLVFVAGAAYWTLINSLLEEYVWRWFVADRFARLLPARLAVIAAGLAFGVHHVIALGAYVPWTTAAAAGAAVAIGGIVWSCHRALSGSVLPGWLSHVLVDAAAFLSIGLLLL